MRDLRHLLLVVLVLCGLLVAAPADAIGRQGLQARPHRTVSLGATPSQPVIGSKVTFKGRVTHTRVGSLVVVQIKTRGHWRTMTVTRTHAGGRFSWVFKPKKIGTRRWRAVALGSSRYARVASRSRSVTTTVISRGITLSSYVTSLQVSGSTQLWGNVFGSPVETPVHLQKFTPGAPDGGWEDLGVVKTTASGAFSWVFAPSTVGYPVLRATVLHTPTLGSASSVPVPLRVGQGPVKLATSSTHTCAIRSGSLYCWGSDSKGQLGNGSTTGNQLKPLRITTYTDWRSITTGQTNTCGIRGTGLLYCWGSDATGEAGNGSKTGNVGTPTQVGTYDDWAAVDASDASVCGIRIGRLFCWGDNSSNQLGLGDTSSRTAPSQVGAGTDWVSIDVGGQTTCGIRSSTAQCWGAGSRGQVGNGTTVNATTLQSVGTDADWTAVAIGGQSACGIRTGSLWCWGNNDGGRLGLPSTAVSVPTPAQVGTDADWSDISTSGSRCGLRAGGQLWCWGLNSAGTLGLGDTVTRTAPTRVGSGMWSTIEVGGSTSCGISDGAVYCWGANPSGQVGNGSTSNATTPQLVGLPN